MNASSSREPLHVHVVENHPDTLKYLRIYLEALGHTVSVASTMAEALATIPGARADVLIADIGLPDGDGWELLRRLKGQGDPPGYAIAMSGFGLSEDRQKSHAAGYRHHLRKPFDPEILDRLLEEAIRERVAGR